MNQKKTIATFYAFTSFPGFQELRRPLVEFCRSRNIAGSILLAEEGINATVSGPEEGVLALLDFLRSNPIFEGKLAELEAKLSYADPGTHTFSRLKVKLKKEIVTLGRQDADPRVKVGNYVDPKHWNQLISDPDVVVVDTRNDYEVQIGTFKGAVQYHTKSFRELPAQILGSLDPGKQKKIAMFCTGGIRCEKATSFMLAQGFEEVYHLKGGILKYLEEVPQEQSLWEGECFVFDHRVTVDHTLRPGSFELCMACGRPITEEVKTSSRFEDGVSCPGCYEEKSDEDRSRFRERQRQVELAKRRGKQHIGNR